MEWIIKECVETAGCELEVSAAFIGEDVLICLKGGERPHLGAYRNNYHYRPTSLCRKATLF